MCKMTIQKNNEKVEFNMLKKIDLDAVLINEISQYGKFQLRNSMLILLVVIFSGFATSETLFTSSRVSKRCLIPECEGQKAEEFSPPWILNAVPRSGGTFNNCQRFISINTSAIENQVCPKDIFDHNVAVICNQFVYEHSNSIVSEYDLGCDEWRRAIIGSLRTVGTLASFPITGYISDRYGRRTAIIFSSIYSATVGVMRYFSNSYFSYLVLKVAEATLGSGAFSSSYILMMEIVRPKYRVAAGATINTFFAIGQVMTGLIAFKIPHWRQLTLVLYVPQFITIAYLWMMTESVRWYLSKGYYKKAENVLKVASRENGRELSPKLLLVLTDMIDEENSNQPWLISLVFRNKKILTRVLVTPIWWITMTLVYYGLSINSVNMSENRHHNFILVSVVEIPGFWIAVILVGRIGRKPVLIGSYWLCGLCQIAYIFLFKEYYSISLIIYLIGKCSISMVTTALYVYTTELYPTSHRHSLFAFSSMIGRLGSVIAPLTPAFSYTVWKHFSFALFAGLALFSGLLVFFTPETLSTKLPDTMEEATDIGIKSAELNI